MSKLDGAEGRTANESTLVRWPGLHSLFERQPLDTEALWQEAQAFVDKGKGLLALDDMTLDKLYPRKMELVTHHWSGKHQFPATFGCTIGPYRERPVTTIVGLAGEGKGVGPGARVCADG